VPERVEVGCYAGGRGDEVPRVVLLGEQEVTLRVERRWLESRSDRPVASAAGCSRSGWRMAAAAASRRSRMVRGHFRTRQTVANDPGQVCARGAVRRMVGMVCGWWSVAFRNRLRRRGIGLTLHRT
jgi:hypothetical protein